MIKNIAVVGSGTMGHGVAESFAMYEYNHIRIRDLIGFTVLLFIIGNIVAITGIMLFQ